MSSTLIYILFGAVSRWASDQKTNFQITKIAEAREFRETQAIREKGQETVVTAVEQGPPKTIENLFGNGIE